MKLRILKRHIENGFCRSERRCPIALALTERFGGTWRVGYFTCVSDEGGIPLSTEARIFARRFDSYAPVKPGWLEVWK